VEIAGTGKVINKIPVYNHFAYRLMIWREKENPVKSERGIASIGNYVLIVCRQ
jgi:hypothetical protein